MTDDFERQLRVLFAETSAAQRSEALELEVRARIARLRLLRRALAPAALVLAAIALAAIGGPVIQAGAALLVEATAPVVAAPAAWLWSPIAYAIGALSVVAALIDALSD